MPPYNPQRLPVVVYSGIGVCRTTGRSYTGYDGDSRTGTDFVIGVDWDVYGPKYNCEYSLLWQLRESLR